MSRVLAAFVFTGTIVAACSGTDPDLGAANGSADGGGGAVEAGSGSGSDATAPPVDDGGAVGKDTGDATAEAGTTGPNLLKDPDFEDFNCNHWKGGEAKPVTESTNPQHGHVACRVCADGSQNYWNLSQLIYATGLVEGDYVASVWLRLPDSGPGPTALKLGTDPHGFDTADDQVDETNPLPVTAAWTQFSKPFHYVPSAAIEGIEFQILDRDSDNGCIIVDNASFARVSGS